MNIAFYDTKPYDKIYFEKVNLMFKNNIKFLEDKLNPDTAVLAKGYDAVCAFVNDTISSRAIKNLYGYGIKIIAMRCAGYNNVNFKEAYEKIHIVRVPAYSPYAVAEHAAALMLSVNRKTYRAYNRTRDNNFNIDGLLGFDLFGKTAGIIGTGKIGSVFIDICKGFGMKVLAYDLYPRKTDDFEYVPLEKLYREADIISLHCPLTRDTKHLINKESIKMMKKGVMIINTSRGGLIDSEDLIMGLKEQKIRGAGLDVYEEESRYFFEDLSNRFINDDVLARLLTFPNVLITSHQGFFTHEALENIAKVTLENLDDYQKGSYLKNEICYKCLNQAECRKKKGLNCF